MKKIFNLVLICLTLVSFKIKLENFFISGTIKEIENGKKIYLETQNENYESYLIDSTVIQNGKFEFKGTFDYPKLCNLYLENFQQRKLVFIVEKEKIEITIDSDTISNSIVSGGKVNYDFKKFSEKTKITSKKVKKELEIYQNNLIVTYQKAIKNKNTKLAKKIISDYNTIQEVIFEDYYNFIETHPNSDLSLLIINGMIYSDKIKILKDRKLFEILDPTLKNSVLGKSIEQKIKDIESKKNIKRPNLKIRKKNNL